MGGLLFIESPFAWFSVSLHSFFCFISFLFLSFSLMLDSLERSLTFLHIFYYLASAILKAIIKSNGNHNGVGDGNYVHDGKTFTDNAL